MIYGCQWVCILWLCATSKHTKCINNVHSRALFIWVAEPTVRQYLNVHINKNGSKVCETNFVHLRFNGLSSQIRGNFEIAVALWWEIDFYSGVKETVRQSSLNQNDRHHQIRQILWPKKLSFFLSSTFVWQICQLNSLFMQNKHLLIGFDIEQFNDNAIFVWQIHVSHWN